MTFPSPMIRSSALARLQAKQLAAGVALQPLIFSKKLQVSIPFTITEPQVVLLHAASGKWNYSSLGSVIEVYV